MANIGFHAHGFAIIDLVPENELQTARQMEENLKDYIAAAGSGLFCKRYCCCTESELFEALNEIECRLREQGEISYVHIEGHASKDLLQLPDGSTVDWSRVFERFRTINVLSKNNLFFSSGACESAFALRAARITEPCPVFGLLAPEQEVTAGGVIAGFTAFYKSLIESENLNDAFAAFAEATNGKKYALIFSQLLFEKAVYRYLVQNCMGKGRRDQLDGLLTEAVDTVDASVKVARKALKKELFGPQALRLAQFHKRFMMIDRYPENAGRFQFDAVRFERAVRDGKLKLV